VNNQDQCDCCNGRDSVKLIEGTFFCWYCYTVQLPAAEVAAAERSGRYIEGYGPARFQARRDVWSLA
jgi:hypothetical protein